MPYDEAMLRYGTDRPDRRPGHGDPRPRRRSSRARSSRCSPARSSRGGVVRGFRARGGECPRKRFDDLTEQREGARREGARVGGRRGRRRAGARRSRSSCRRRRWRAAAARARRGRGRRAAASSPTSRAVAARVLGELRARGRRAAGGPRPAAGSSTSRCSSGTRTRAASTRSTTRSPRPTGDLDGDPAAWRSRAYDVVMDGWELGGGSIRINRPRRPAEGLRRDRHRRARRPASASASCSRRSRYGAPPHGGIAFGLDRIVALLAGRDSIRDVIAVPEDGDRRRTC